MTKQEQEKIVTVALPWVDFDFITDLVQVASETEATDEIKFRLRHVIASINAQMRLQQ